MSDILLKEAPARIDGVIQTRYQPVGSLHIAIHTGSQRRQHEERTTCFGVLFTEHQVVVVCHSIECTHGLSIALIVIRYAGNSGVINCSALSIIHVIPIVLQDLIIQSRRNVFCDSTKSFPGDYFIVIGLVGSTILVVTKVLIQHVGEQTCIQSGQTVQFTNPRIGLRLKRCGLSVILVAPPNSTVTTGLFLIGAESQRSHIQFRSEVRHMVGFAFVAGTTCLPVLSVKVFIKIIFPTLCRGHRASGSLITPEDGVDGKVPTFSVVMFITRSQRTGGSTKVVVEEVVDSREGHCFVAYKVAVAGTNQTCFRTGYHTCIALTSIRIVHSSMSNLIWRSSCLVVIKQRIPHMTLVIGGNSTTCRPWDKLLVFFRNRANCQILRVVTTEVVDGTIGVQSTTVTRHIVFDKTGSKNQRNIALSNTKHLRQVGMIVERSIPVSFHQDTTTTEVGKGLGIRAFVAHVNLVGISTGDSHAIDDDGSGIVALLGLCLKVSEQGSGIAGRTGRNSTPEKSR